MPFQPVRAESLSAQVFETIRDAIFRGELKPGETLRELGLAKTLNVSQATVREALAHLEQYGLVVRTPNRSTNVTSFSPEEAVQRQVVRCNLETLAFMEARERMTPEDLEEINALAEQAERASGNGAFEAIQAERRFHSRIWELSGNGVLTRTLEQVAMPLFVRRAHNRPSDGVHYRNLASALKEGDAQQIGEALKEHIIKPIKDTGEEEPAMVAAGGGGSI